MAPRDFAISALAKVGRHSHRLAELRRIARRQEPGLTLVDGVRLVRDVADAGLEVLELYVTPERLVELSSWPRLKPLLAAGQVFLLDESTMQRVAPTTHSQGVLAVVAAPARALRVTGIVLYLDRIQEPGNVGALIRCAAALGASGVACSDGCADPFSPRAIRASAGRSLFLPTVADQAFHPLAASFRAAGGEVAGTSGRAGLPLSRWRPRLPLLLALGNEGEGLTEDVIGGCSRLVTIPLTAAVESLNVAVAAGIILAAASGLVSSPILKGEEGVGDDTPP